MRLALYDTIAHFKMKLLLLRYFAVSKIRLH